MSTKPKPKLKPRRHRPLRSRIRHVVCRNRPSINGEPVDRERFEKELAELYHEKVLRPFKERAQKHVRLIATWEKLVMPWKGV